MADDDQNRTREADAEREAEIDSEMKRVDQDPDQVKEGSENLGTQNAESGAPEGERGPMDEEGVEEEEEEEEEEMDEEEESEDEGTQDDNQYGGESEGDIDAVEQTEMVDGNDDED